jgi:hypothetical protein
MITIKYAVWGTKRGKSTFFHSRDLTNEEINDTLNDVRGAVTIREPNCNYYSIGFTANSKIYSQYFPVNDALGRPGFLAVTLYIPHNEKLDPENTDAPCVLHLLNSMMNLYRSNYVDDQSRMILPLIEDVSLFDDEIARVSTIPDHDYPGLSQTKNDSIKIVRYNTDDELKQYFDLPYQDVYFEHRQILFIPSALDRKFNDDLMLNIVPPQRPTYRIIVADAECTFTVNGEKRNVAENLSPSDYINIYARKPYFYEFSFPNERKVSDILLENRLTTKENTIQLKLVFCPMQKIIAFDIHDKNDKTTLKATVSSKSLETVDSKITIRGEQLKEKHSILIEADGYKTVATVVGPYSEDHADKDVIAVPLEKLPETSLTPPSTPELSAQNDVLRVKIYVYVDHILKKSKIYEGEIYWGESEELVNIAKTKLDKSVELTFKIPEYSDIRKKVTINNEPIICVYITKKDIEEQSPKSEEIKDPQQTRQTQPPPQPPEDDKNRFADYFNRNTVWIIAVVSILALVVFIYKIGIFDMLLSPKPEILQVVIQLQHGDSTIEINSDNVIRIDNSSVLSEHGIIFSAYNDTIKFTNDTTLKVPATIHLNHKKYGANIIQYDTSILISAKDSVRIIQLRETDTVMKINNLIAKLDSISISYRDIKVLKELDLPDGDLKRKIKIIDSIFFRLNVFNPDPKPKSENYKPEIWAEKEDRYYKQYQDLYDKINPLKNEFFKDELKDLGRDKITKEANWIIRRMDGLKPKEKLRENATLEDIFTKKKK